MWAAEEGQTEIVEKILKQYPELVNKKDRDGYTALHKTCYNNHYETAKVLISYGADLDARTNMQWTPLHSACKWNNPKMVALLLQNGANINATSEGDQTPLHIACTVSDCRDTIVTLFMNEKLDPNILNNSGETAFQIAKRTGLSTGYFEMMKSGFKVDLPQVTVIESDGPE